MWGVTVGAVAVRTTSPLLLIIHPWASTTCTAVELVGWVTTAELDRGSAGDRERSQICVTGVCITSVLLMTLALLLTFDLL